MEKEQILREQLKDATIQLEICINEIEKLRKINSECISRLDMFDDVMYLVRARSGAQGRIQSVPDLIHDAKKTLHYIRESHI